MFQRELWEFSHFQSKEALTVLIVTHVTQVERVESGVCSFYATLHTEYCTVTQFVTHIKRVESIKYYVLYSVYSGPSPLPGGKAI